MKKDIASVVADNPVFALNHAKDSSWRFRRDERRILLFKQETDTMSASEVYRLHPTEAVLLAVLHGQRFEDAVARGAQLFRRTTDEMRQWYEAKLAKWMDRSAIDVVPDGTTVAPLDPAQYVMPAADVDVQRWWLYRPLDLTIKVTDSCQRQCRYCSVERRKDHPTPSTETWLRLIHEALDHDIVSISLVGGDPILHHGLNDMIRAITSRGIQPFISTKVFVSRQTAEALREAGLERIQISIDSDIDGVEDYLVDSPGAAKQLLASIENCIAAGLRVRTNSVITPFNVLGFPDLVRRLHDLGVTTMGTSQCGYSLFVENIDDLLLREAEGKWLEKEVRRIRDGGIDARFSSFTEKERREKFDTRAYCTAGVWSIIVNSDGTAMLCDDLPANDAFIIGNVFTAPLLDVWNSEAANRFRNPTRDLFEGTVCAECDVFDRCTQSPRLCFRDAYFAYGRAFAPPPQCPKAPEPAVRISH